jgi:hypothetical protein
MSLQWPAQQQAFAAALLDPDVAVPDFLRARAGARLEDRFDIYRNNVHASLGEALFAAFPVTARLVGEEFFRALAIEFLRRHLPGRAPLHDYGAQLPAYIRAHPAAVSLPYLADVAALEQAWWQAYGAADAQAMSVPDLAAVPGEQLLAMRARLHPAVRLLQSAHPVHGLWMAHQVEGEPAPVAQWQAECVLLTRPEATVQLRRIEPSQHALLAALGAGARLEEAAGIALVNDPDFDFGSALLLAVEAGALQELNP